MTAGIILWVIVMYYGFGFIKSAYTRLAGTIPRWEITLWGGLFHFGLVILALAVGRATEGLDSVLISRYKHIGFIWLILIILLVSTKCKPAQTLSFSKIWVVVSFCLFLFSYFQYIAPLDYYYKERYTDIYGWQYNRAIPSSPIYLNVRPIVDTVTIQAIQAGVYRLPNHYFLMVPIKKIMRTSP